jgi:tetratricopeptide (TPR) repeat protein
MRKVAIHACTILAVALVAASMPDHSICAQEAQLGKINFPTSGAAEAQPDFIRGVLLLHSFEYAPARAAFQKAQAVDPDFAMAYWGEAMTHHHSLWGVQALQSGQDALAKLGATHEERTAKAATDREKGFIRATEILFGLTEKTAGLGKVERDVHYRSAMRDVFEANPGDMEARAFYALSILGVGSVNRDYATYIRAAALLTPVWDANREHPGAAHYLIHSYDDPVHAILGLPMARTYGEIAVGAAHAQHMTSHIYVALGLWDDMISANVTALSVESAKTVGEGARSREAWHHRYWMHYGRLQQGRLEDAEVLLQWALARLRNDPKPLERAYFGAMFARYVFDAEAWEDAENWLAPDDVDIPTPHYTFARAFAAAKRGDLNMARDLAGEIRDGGLGNPEIILAPMELEILQLEIDGIISLAEGQDQEAVTLLKKAVELQTSMPFRYGPPRISKPTAELLGDVLLSLGDAEGAAAAYMDQLSRTLLRTNSLLGLARASEQLDDSIAAEEAYGELAAIWHDADPTFQALNEIRGKTEAR